MNKGLGADDLVNAKVLNFHQYDAMSLSRGCYIRITRAYILENVTQPMSDEPTWMEFLANPAVSWSIANQDRPAFEHLYQLQIPLMSVLCSYVIADALKYCHFLDELQCGLFLLDYLIVRGDRTSYYHRLSWLWTAPLSVVVHPEWWYALFRRRWNPTCTYTSALTNQAFDKGKAIWNAQRHVALLVFALARRVSPRDVARLLAEEVLKMNWVY
jgi:hypothetical protein